jgi:SAM-dependent methyltransferase
MTTLEVGADSAVRCAFCDSQSLSSIIDFGRMALAGAFLKPQQFANERKYPLRLYFCNACYAVQIIDRVSPDVLFSNYFYFSSSIRTLREHFVHYAGEVVGRFLPAPQRSVVVEIGCNDGVLLGPLADQGIGAVIGVDPATNVVGTISDPRITVVNDFFDDRVAERISASHGNVDMVVANNVYAHIPDIQGTTRAIRKILKPDGVFVFEVHYLGKIIHELQYDMIYHEHLYYHSLLSLDNHFDRYDMMIFDVKPVPIHAGSMRYYVCNKGSRHKSSVSPQVAALRAAEEASGFHKAETFARFAADVADRKRRLMELLLDIRASGRTVVGYGASGRANTLLQYCGISHEHMESIIDDAPAKTGFYTPGSHFLIRTNSVLRESPPDYLLIFAWSFLSEITQKCIEFLRRGGRLIVPLPDVRVITQQVPGSERL